MLAGQGLSSRTDLFSLGALLGYLCLGHSPFDVPLGSAKAQYLSAIVRALAEGTLAARMDGLMPGLGPLVQGMVALDPMGRPGHVAAAVEDLRGLLEASSRPTEDDSLESTLVHSGPPAVRAADLDKSPAPASIGSRTDTITDVLSLIHI